MLDAHAPHRQARCAAGWGGDGRPTIRGLRYPVEVLLELMSSGMSIEETLADSEDLERDDILAALADAAQVTRVERIEGAAA
jgi:uncharacterized protein (DUF433 family)